VRPPQLEYETTLEPGKYWAEFDPSGDRFFTSWATKTVTVFDLRRSPPRLPEALADRTHWAHDGAFVADGSFLTSRNGVDSGPVARWKAWSPHRWTLDPGAEHSQAPLAVPPDGTYAFAWTRAGDVIGLPLMAGERRHAGKVGHLGGWRSGMGDQMMVDSGGTRVMAVHGPGLSVLDLDQGDVRHWAIDSTLAYGGGFSPSGSRALLFLPDEGTGYKVSGPGRLVLIDLDAMDQAGQRELGADMIRDLQLLDDETAAILWGDCLVAYDLIDPSSPPDTLWSGDCELGGRIFEEGRTLVVRDRENGVALVDREAGTRTELGHATGWRYHFAFDRKAKLVALGGWGDEVNVWDLESGREWRLPVAEEGGTKVVFIDPLGRWLLINRTAWSLPLDPVFSGLPTEEMLARLRTLTNVRVVPDEAEADGFRVSNVQLLATE
jgi:hypothetical protein